MATAQPRILLGSGGFRDATRVDFLIQSMREHFGEVDELLFIPYALNDYDAYVETFRKNGMDAGYQLRPIHKENDPITAVKQAKGIYIGGGNTFRLLKQLRAHKLLEPIRERVLKDGIPYLGISAGTVVACPSIATSNDMPITDPVSFDSLGLVKFQVNAHFSSGPFYSKSPGHGEYELHYGETRDERIAQFHEESPIPVLGLAEGYILKCYGPKVELLGGPSTRGGALKIFRQNHPPLDVEGVSGEDLAPLIWDQAAHAGLVPLPTLFGNPVKTQARISPDGRYISYLSPSKEKDILNVWVVERHHGVDSTEARMVTNDVKRGIRDHFWAENSKDILYMQDVGGDENFHILSVRVTEEHPTVRDLTPFQDVRAQNIILSKRKPDEVLVGLNVRTRQVFDAYRITLGTGACVLDTENPGDVLSWHTDPDFVIRGAYAADPAEGGRILRSRKSADDDWKVIKTWSFEEQSGVVSFSAKGDSMYVVSSLDSDTTQLFEMDAETGKELNVLVSDPSCDVGSIIVNDETFEVEAVELNYQMREWKVLDSKISDDFKAIEDAIGKEGRREFSVVARGDNDQVWVVAVSADVVPTAYYLYYRSTKAVDLLFVERPELLKYPLGTVKPVIIPTSDSMKLVSYVTLPPSVSSSWQPALDSPSLTLPMVLLVHGGPWARDGWGFNPLAQLLASRGYACLQVNYRGSSGFGKEFLNAGNGEWGVGAMQRDLTEAVDWAVAWGIADRSKVAIMGGSYGGYACLAGLVFTPDVYCCGIDIVGPAHIKTLFESIPPYWKPMKRQLAKRVGDVENDEELNRRISPLFHAKNIKVPLMIAQGANDPRVKKAESDQMVDAIRHQGLEVTYCVYSDEGHGFARPVDKLDFYNRVEAFLAKHMGGKYLQVHDPKVFEGNSATLE